MTPDLLIGLGTGGALTLLGMLIGRFGHTPKNSKSERPPQAICSCDHGYGMHDKETGKCHGQVDIPSYYNSVGKAVEWKKGECPCRHYDGPQPIEQYFATQTLPPRDSA